MKMPKYKPTKWKVPFCAECHKVLLWGDTCDNHNEHKMIDLDNIPFFVPDMRVTGASHNWMHLRSDTLGQDFNIILSNAVVFLTDLGIGLGGLLSGGWWMWTKQGGYFTVKVVR